MVLGSGVFLKRFSKSSRKIEYQVKKLFFQTPISISAGDFF
jgi:hypothetical protein